MNKFAMTLLSLMVMTLTANAGSKQLNECRLYSYNQDSEVYLIKQVEQTVEASLQTPDTITNQIVEKGLVPYTIQGISSRTITIKKEMASTVSLADIVQNKNVLSQVLANLTENLEGVTQAIQNLSIKDDCK